MAISYSSVSTKVFINSTLINNPFFELMQAHVGNNYFTKICALYFYSILQII